MFCAAQAVTTFGRGGEVWVGLKDYCQVINWRKLTPGGGGNHLATLVASFGWQMGLHSSGGQRRERERERERERTSCKWGPTGEAQ